MSARRKTTATTTVPPTTTTAAPPPTTSVSPTGAASPTTSTCGANPVSQFAATGQATQVILVESPDYDTTYASLSAWQRDGACWNAVFGPWSARIGENGFSDHHVEGDGTTPTGAYGIGPVMYGISPNPGVHYQYHQLVCGDWWDEDPSSPTYNTFQHVPCGTAPPFGGDSEPLWEETATYGSFALIDYNTSPVVAGAGSAIFLHVDDGDATTGCVSVPVDELDELLDWLVPGDSPLIVMGPTSEIDRF